MMRAATISSSLEAEQYNGNMDKTQSKATPNEASSLGTTLGGVPRCQDTMRDTIAQTRFENVSKFFNDSLLAREKTKTSQALEITSLKKRVKKLEKKQKSRTYKLKRLYEVGLIARVDSSKDDQSLGEDASKQGKKITYIDANEDITLVNDQDDAEMFDVNNLDCEEVFVEKEVADKEIDADYQLAERLQAEEQQELTDEEKATLFMQFLEKRRNFFAAKRTEEKRNKPPIQAQKRKIMCTYLKNMEGKKLNDLKNKSFNSIQKMFDRAFHRVNTFVDFRT
nr:hypothetical protein [Tanacetum cinerariifolium]